MTEKDNQIRAFEALLYLLVEDTAYEADKELSVDLIINPHSGSFNHAPTRRKIIGELEKVTGDFADRRRDPRRSGGLHFRAHLTTAPGCETALVRALLAEDGAPPPARMILVAGGDGTARYVLEALMHQPPEIQKSTILLRLPMGTGNDGADVADWKGVAALLAGDFRVIDIDTWKIEGGGLKEPAYGFNISSVGLDAYIVELNSRARKILPGNFYTLMTNAAGLLYGPRVGHPKWTISLTRSGQTEELPVEDYFLAAFGVSGHRTYGAGKKVLPDERNVCLVRRAPVTKLLAFSKYLFEGRHEQLPWVSLKTADHITISAEGTLPANIDGEPFWVAKDQWPLSFTLIDPGIRVLKPGSHREVRL